MRFPLAVLGLSVLLLLPAATAAEDVRAPRKVGEILRVLAAPQLAPGESGDFKVLLTNPYLGSLRNATFTSQIYFYATIEGGQPVDQNWTSSFPRFANGTDASRRELTIRYGTLPRGNFTAPSTIETSREMPHGSVFSQAAYFVRFRFLFDYDNGTGEKRYTMASPGYFPRDLWDRARNGTCSKGPCLGNIDLGLLGVDGIIPDTAFGVKEPIPIWPLWLLVGFMGFFLVLAFLFWVEEHPASFPRIERAWAVTRGKLRQLVAFYGPRRRP